LVYDTEIFSAFAYFDSNVCGYILDKDLEEIIYSIGLDLSRGEIQRTVKKLSARDKINYRNLTDKWVNKDGEIKHIPSTKNDLRSKNDLLKGLYSLDSISRPWINSNF
jgi:hypothetical protein